MSLTNPQSPIWKIRPHHHRRKVTLVVITMTISIIKELTELRDKLCLNKATEALKRLIQQPRSLSWKDKDLHAHVGSGELAARHRKNRRARVWVGKTMLLPQAPGARQIVLKQKREAVTTPTVQANNNRPTCHMDIMSNQRQLLSRPSGVVGLVLLGDRKLLANSPMSREGIHPTILRFYKTPKIVATMKPAEWLIQEKAQHKNYLRCRLNPVLLIRQKLRTPRVKKNLRRKGQIENDRNYDASLKQLIRVRTNQQRRNEDSNIGAISLVISTGYIILHIHFQICTGRE